MNIRENIKFVLKSRGLTQGELADKMGVSRRSIQYYTNGNITVETLVKIADALNTTVETLVSETPLEMKLGPIPEKKNTTATRLTCPHCGGEIAIVARES